MKTRIYPRPPIAALALLAVLTLSSCGGGGNDNADNPSPSSSTAPAAKISPSGGATTTASNPIPGGKSTTTTTTTTTEKLPGVAPKGTDCPSSEPVKGNVTTKRGKIYHLANTPDYKTTKPETCFKDKAAAEAAGFHAPGAANK